MASILENYESLASSKAGAATDHDESWQKLGGLIRAMWELEYPIPSQVPPDSRYAILLQISIGQEVCPPDAPPDPPKPLAA